MGGAWCAWSCCVPAGAAQVEFVSAASQSSSTTVVTFDLLSGGQFTASGLAITSGDTYTAAVLAQLADQDSTLNRGTYTYAAATTGVSAAPSRTAPASILALAALAVAVLA